MIQGGEDGATDISYTAGLCIFVSLIQGSFILTVSEGLVWPVENRATTMWKVLPRETIPLKGTLVNKWSIVDGGGQ